MGKTFFDKIDRERSLSQSRNPKIVEQLCRITLAADAPEHYDIDWCEGLGKKNILYVLEPGKSIVWPLNKARSYFGPFDIQEQYEKTTDEKAINEMRTLISTEKARYVNRYDYPRNREGQPVGPHRSPDVTISLIGANGRDEKPVRLYEMYGLGEFDDYTFDHKPSVEELEAKYTAQLEAKDAEIAKERQEMAERMARLEGRFDGAVAGAVASQISKATKAPAKGPEPALV